MKKIEALLVSALMLCANQVALSQKQHQILGKVVDEYGKPIPNVSLRLSHAGNIFSDDNGEFLFNLPANIGPGNEIEFILQDDLINGDTLVIYEPPRGVCNVPKDPFEHPIRIVLLPKGDHRLLSKEGLMLLIEEINKNKIKREIENLRIRVTKLEQQQVMSTVENPPTVEDLIIKKEAKRLGFTKEKLIYDLEKLKKQLHDSNDPYEAGLAFLNDKNFSKAVELITQSIKTDEGQVKEITAELSEKYMNLGNAYVGKNKLNEAVTAYQKAIDLRPENFEVYFSLIRVLFTIGDQQGMLKTSQKLFTIIRIANAGQVTQSEGIALSYIGLCFDNLGEPDSSRIYFQAAFKLYHQIGDQKGEADVLGHLGVLFSKAGRSDRARSCYQAALKIYRKFGDREREAFVLSDLGDIFSNSGQPEHARSCYQAALKIHREIDYRQLEALDLTSIGLLFLKLGQPDSSRIYFQEAFKIYRKIGDREREAYVLDYLGLVYLTLDQAGSARSCYQSAFKTYHEIGNQEREAYVLDHLGSLYLKVDQFGMANIYYRAALKIYREINDAKDQADVLGNIGLLHHSLDQFGSARDCYQEALKIYRDIGDLKGEADALGNIGLLHLSLDQPGSARNCYKAALKIYRRIGDKKGEADVLGHLGDVFRKEDRPEIARSCYQAALKIYRKIGDLKGEADVLNNIQYKLVAPTRK